MINLGIQGACDEAMYQVRIYKTFKHLYRNIYPNTFITSIV